MPGAAAGRAGAGLAGREYGERENAAAAKIQAAVRGRASRKATRGLREERQAEAAERRGQERQEEAERRRREKEQAQQAEEAEAERRAGEAAAAEEEKAQAAAREQEREREQQVLLAQLQQLGVTDPEDGLDEAALAFSNRRAAVRTISRKASRGSATAGRTASGAAPPLGGAGGTQAEGETATAGRTASGAPPMGGTGGTVAEGTVAAAGAGAEAGGVVQGGGDAGASATQAGEPGAGAEAGGDGRGDTHAAGHGDDGEESDVASSHEGSLGGEVEIEGGIEGSGGRGGGGGGGGQHVGGALGDVLALGLPGGALSSMDSDDIVRHLVRQGTLGEEEGGHDAGAAGTEQGAALDGDDVF